MTSSTTRRPPRPNGGARRRAAARRQRRNRLLVGASITLVVVLIALVVTLHVVNRGSGSASATSPSGSTTASLAIGTAAPNGTVTTLAGAPKSVASLRGRPALIWFVTTWCSSCEAGTQTMAQSIPTLAADGVRVVEIENYADFGQSGPTMRAFARSLAGSAFTNPDWTFGEASSALTRTYNPRAYLDIYYLINAKGKIVYVNGSPSSTMPELLQAAKSLA
ncbi:MAG: TlpA family protein disulfide reductase [Acidimicrobiales bacterium]